MNKFSYDNNQTIAYTEFLAATIEIDMKEIPEKRRDAIFKMFDVDNTDVISREDIKKAFNKISRNISEDQIDEIFKEFNTDNDQVISRQEWRNVVDLIMGQPDPVEIEHYENNDDEKETPDMQ